MTLSFNLQQEPKIEVPEEQQFQLQYTAQQTRDIIKGYERSPASFDEESISNIEKHAQYHNIPFYSGEFSLIDAVMDVGKGFVSGFTTLEMFDHPDNEYEAIARNIGHLAGFAPGIAAAPFKAMGAKTLAATAAALNDYSIPMAAANFATKNVKKLVKPILNSASGSQFKAMNTATEFMLGNQAKHIAEGAFHLGTASAVSSWQQGVDVMMDSFLHGGIAGGVFRGLGNLVNSGDPKGDKIIRQISGSLFMGLPAQERGATTPEVIYEYLLGAYFGGKEGPWYKAKASKAIKELEKQSQKDPKLDVLKDPTLMKGFEEMAPEVQKEVVKMAEEIYGNLDERSSMAGHLLEMLGIEDKADPKNYELIRDVIKAAGPEGKEVAVEDGVVREEKVGDKTVMRFVNLEVEKSLITDKLATLEKQMETADAAQKIILQREIDTLNAELRKSADLEKQVRDLEAGELINFDSGEILNRMDIDIGMKDDAILESKPYYFVKTHVKLPKEVQGREAEMEVAAKVQKLVNDWTKQQITDGAKTKNRGDVRFDTEELAATIEKEIGSGIGEQGRADLRRWATERTFGDRINYLTTDGDMISLKPSTHSLGGKRKVDIVPISPIEKAFYMAGGEPPKEARTPLIILDSITGKNEAGKTIDYSLSDYRQKYNKEYKSVLSNIIRKMAKRDYYPFAGTGDKDRIMFMKIHPAVKNPKLLRKTALLRDVDNKFFRDKYFKKSEKEFIKAHLFRKKKGDKYKSLTRNELKKFHKDAFVSNLLYDLDINGLAPTVKNLNQLLGKGYIKDGTALNKRMQIWMTNGYEADPAVLGTNSLNYILVPTVSGKKAHKKLYANIKNSELEQHMDGAILVRDDLLDKMNIDAGMPESGQNKSFIISPHSKYGALLGKFMFHAVGPEMTAQMARNGIDMIIPDSAAKQAGTRKFGDYSIHDLDLSMELAPGTQIYTMKPEHIKYSYGVKQGEHMNSPQRVFKQIWTSLTSTAYSPFNQEVVSDMFNSVIGDRFAGKKEWNAKLEKYLETRDPAKLEELEKNIENIGVEELLKAAHSQNGTAFADTIYSHMLKMNKKLINELVAEGEISETEGAEAFNRVEEFDTGTQRIMKEAQKWAQEQRGQGKDVSALPVYLHKYVRAYRMAVMQNFLIFNVTRPKIGNSAAMRMRPYDKMLQIKLEKLNSKKEEAEELFYLDEDINPMLETHIPEYGKIRLKDLWNEYQKRTDGGKKDWVHKEDVEEIFRAAMVRIPMDSVSGTSVLRFGGYTGIKGHGVLLHGRIMEKLGGADLDGDEAFVFFGGRKGKEGNGWKKEWKDEFYKNKDEYAEGTGAKKHTPDRKSGLIVRPDGKYAKMSWRELLTQTAKPAEKKAMESKAYQYSPYWRTEISRRAVEGRKMLGGAVNMPQVMKAVHDVILNSKYKNDRYKIAIGKGEYEVTITPRTQKQWLKYARQLGAAQVAFGSDPLDETGLKGYDVFFKELFDAYFKVDVKKRYGKRFHKWTDEKTLDIIKSSVVRNHGMYRKVKNISDAYFSKNYTDNRRYTMHEIRDLVKSMTAGEFSEAQMNTPLMKMAGLLHKLDWSDSVYNRVNKQRLEDAYANVARFIKEIPEIAKKVFNRKTFKVKRNQYIDKMIANKLHTKTGIEEAAARYETFERIIHNTMFDTPHIKKRGRHDASYRARILKELSLYGEDFLINDISDMASIELLSEALSEGKISVKKAGEMHQFVEDLKRQSYLQAMYDIKTNFKNGNRTEEDAWRDFEQIFNKIEGQTTQKVATKAMNQAEIDVIIKGYRDTLKRSEQRAFDMMMLGSYNRAKIDNLTKAWTEYSRTKGKKGREYASKFFQLVMDASRTSTSMLGINSSAIPSSSVRKYLGKFSEYMSSTWEKPDINPFKEVSKNIQKSNKVEMADGSTQEGNILEKSIDKLTKGSIVEDLEGYQGISKGTLKPENAKIVAELAEHLRHYNNKVGLHLNEITRDLLNKDLNAMNVQDFKQLNNYFKEARQGTIWQRLFGEKSPDMRQRYWMQFPKTVAREMRKYDILWLKGRGMFKTKEGEVKEGVTLKPTTHIEVLQNWIQRFGNNATSVGENKILELNSDLLFLEGLGESGAKIRDIAVKRREFLNQKEITSFANNPKHARKVINDNWNTVKESWNEIKNKQYTITELDGSRTTMYGDRLVKKVNRVYDKFFKKAHELMVGKVYEDGTTALDPFIVKKNGQKQYYDKAEAALEGRAPTEPVIDFNKFIRYVNEMYKRGKDIPLDFGIDGLRQIQRAFLIAISPKNVGIRKKLATFKFTTTGKLKTEGYWPHMFHSKKKVSEALDAGLKELMKDRTLSKEDLATEYKKMQLRHLSLTGEFINTAGQDLDAFDKMIDDFNAGKELSKETIKWVDSNRKVGNMHSRKVYIPGYSFDNVVPETYIRNLVQNYHLHLSQIMARKTLKNFHDAGKKKGWDKIKDPGSDYSLLQRWENWMKLYVQDSLGYPSEVPEKLINDPGMKLKGTPYAWWADNRVKKRVDEIAKKLGLTKHIAKLPEHLQGVSYEQLRHWSNLEAQFELASLLAHPKQVMGNLFGGSAHTIQSAGAKYLMKARDINYVRRIIPEVRSKEDLTAWVIKQGVFPDMIAHEFGLAPELKKANAQQFIKEVTKKLTKSGEVPEETLLELADKYKVKQGVMEKAAAFMSGPERMLRRDSFMAHYIRAWESFGGAIKDPTHPFLIEMGKKGVKATQFLYNAPHRPAFARTALGKVMTRFQLWSWNAVRFRNDILREARIKGLRPGTAIHEKFVRTAQIDLMILALGNIFTYSLFDTAMPAPYNWLSDTAAWLFGDERERDRAFFGTWPANIAPLQLVTPPIARMPAAGLSAYIEDDYKKLTDYYVYTMFPFGRLARDFSPMVDSNLIDNPIRIFEKWGGIPMGQLQRMARNRKDDE
tara:strand:+ start:20842 stop:29580 length:8739 start_codon:yes stop_codon:yes gene_type:complete